MADKAPAFKFTVNVPVPCEIRFIDIRPGKLWTDPDNGKAKMLPSQVSIKGKFGNLDTICFLPGPAWKNIKAFAESGILADPTQAMEDANNTELAAPTAVAFTLGKVTLTIAKPAGERYESLVVDTGGVKPAPAAAARVESPYRAPSGGAKKQPFDEPTAEERGKMISQEFDRMGAAMESRETDGDDGFERFSAAVDAVERPKGKGAAIEDAYLALYSRVAERLVSVGKALEFPVDATGIQAATATIWITLKDKGIQL